MKSKTTIPFLASLILACIINLYSIAQPALFAAHGLSGGGAQYAPSINPLNPAEMYIACDMSPLFHSLDTGNSWNVINFDYINAFHLTQVGFTNNSMIQYCMNNDPLLEYYVPKKTTDGGATWATLAGDPTVGNGAWYTVSNPQNANQVIVSDYDNLYFSNNGGTTFGSSFYHDTTGAGAYIAGTFWDGQNIYICTNIGLLISTNGGTSWTGPSLNGINYPSEAILSFSGAKVGTTTRFYCITYSSNVYVGVTGDNIGSFVHVYTMDYGASNWIPKNNGISSGDQPFWVSMAVNNIDIAYLAGGNVNTSAPIVFKTIDSGALWSYCFHTSTNQNIETGYCGQGGDFNWSWDQYSFGFTVCASDPNIALLTGEGFSHKTTDGGNTWKDVYVPVANLNPANAATPDRHYYPGNGIEVTSGWDLMWYNPQYMFEGTSDINAIRSKDAGTTWGFDYSGLSINCVYKFIKNPANGALYAATSSVHDMYESTRLKDANLDGGSGKIMMSVDSGSTFTPMHDFSHPVVWLALDPTNADRMYASVVNHANGAGGIWVSNNINLGASSTWTHLNSPARTEGHPFNIRVLNDGTIVTSWSGRINPSNVWTDSSGVFASIDGGNTWLDRSDPGMEFWTMDVVIDPWDTAQNTWYVCVFSGWGNLANNSSDGGLYRTTNRGLNWTRINNQTRAYSITFDPIHQGIAYMTSETQGLWYSTDVEAATPTFTQVAGYPFQHPNRVYFNPNNHNQIWVISYGNGIRMGDLTTGINTFSFNNDAVNIYPNPTTGAITINFNIKENTSLNLKLSNLEGQTIYTKQSRQQAGIFTQTFLMDNYAKGIYFLTIITDKETVVKKVVLE